jgi:hypothetical protein
MSAASRTRVVLAPALVLALVVAPRAGAQPLAERVARGGDAVVRFRYDVRPGVCGDGGRSITLRTASGTTTHGYQVRSTGDGAWDTQPCEPGRRASP